MRFPRLGSGRRWIAPGVWLAALFIVGAALPLSGSAPALGIGSILAPTAASSQLYFAHLADGANWTTSLFFSNPNQLMAATVNVSFYSDAGLPLQLDFGSGPVSTLTLTVPAGGVQTVTSKGAGTTTNNGWAHASSTIPLMGTLKYRFTSNGTPTFDVAAVATSPTYSYYSYANPNIGLAVANPSATNAVHVTVAALDASGNAAGNFALTLDPLAHTSFNLGQQLTGLPATFTGSAVMTSTDYPISSFVAYTLNVSSGLLSPLPPGEMQSPAPPDRLLADAAAQLKSSFALWIPTASIYGDFNNQTTANEFLAALNNLTFKITTDTTLTASYQVSNGAPQVSISRPLLETLASSKGAIAFLISHYAMRYAISVHGNPSAVFSNDPASAADLYALISLFMAGMDPSSMTDCYGRLQLANALSTAMPAGQGPVLDPALQTEFLLNGNYTGRIAAVWQDLIVNGCAQGGQQACGVINDLWHPSYPALIP
jgi:hypothetical protein